MDIKVVSTAIPIDTSTLAVGINVNTFVQSAVTVIACDAGSPSTGTTGKRTAAGQGSMGGSGGGTNSTGKAGRTSENQSGRQGLDRPSPRERFDPRSPTQDSHHTGPIRQRLDEPSPSRQHSRDPSPRQRSDDASGQPMGQRKDGGSDPSTYRDEASK
jgi:hypothetical protein